jgi:hypothetical protein
LAEHPECQQYERDYDVWYATHYYNFKQGGTRVGPMHYFRDCRSLRQGDKTKREDARVLELTPELAEALQLQICPQCRERMFPFEAQMAEESSAAVSQ